MESPDLQSSAAPEALPDHCQHDGIPGEKLALLSSLPLHSFDGPGAEWRSSVPREEPHLDST